MAPSCGSGSRELASRQPPWWPWLRRGAPVYPGFGQDGDGLLPWFDDVTALHARRSLGTDKTPIEVKPVAFTPTFSASDTARKLWLALVRRGKLTKAPERFGEVVDSIGSFLSPVAASCLGDARFEESWTAPGPWKKPRPA